MTDNPPSPPPALPPGNPITQEGLNLLYQELGRRTHELLEALLRAQAAEQRAALAALPPVPPGEGG